MNDCFIQTSKYTFKMSKIDHFKCLYRDKGTHTLYASVEGIGEVSLCDLFDIDEVNATCIFNNFIEWFIEQQENKIIISTIEISGKAYDLFKRFKGE